MSAAGHDTRSQQQIRASPTFGVAPGLAQLICLPSAEALGLNVSSSGLGPVASSSGVGPVFHLRLGRRFRPPTGAVFHSKDQRGSIPRCGAEIWNVGDLRSMQDR